MPRRRGVRSTLTACLLVVALLAPPAIAVTPQQVDAAIHKGVAYLYSQQNDKGHWETNFAGPGPQARIDPNNNDPAQGQWGGMTALSTYALLVAGESYKDKRLRDALEWQNKAPMIGVYAIGLRAQAWMYLPRTKGVKDAAKRDGAMLMGGMKRAGEARAMWHYFVADGPAIRYDHSTAQIALLGVWACQQAGMEISDAFWIESEKAWKAHQYEDGGWSYRYKDPGKHGEAKISMTLAGVATLFMAEDFVHVNDGIACKGNVFDDALVRGTRWIQNNLGGGGQVTDGYVLYGMQRVALASGFKYFGTYDWYRNASEALLTAQKPDGSWDGARGGPVASTAWAVIVLSRGRAPVILNKFEYELEGTPPPVKVVPKPPAPKPPVVRPPVVRPTPTRAGQKPVQPAPQPPPPPPVVEPPAVDPNVPQIFVGNWCQRPRDVAQFTRWMTDVTERKLAWQVISSKNTVDDLHDAPILYIAGNQKLTFPKDVVDKLRQYVEEGGLIYGQADCGNKLFTDSFIELGKQLFPMYEFRELPTDHPIFTRQQYQRKNWKNPPNVIGLSNGARELMITLPGSDIARNWQTMSYNGKEEAFQVMNGIVLYAVDRQNLRYKGATHIVRATGGGGRAVKVARLEFAGNWNPEPGSWRRLAAVIGNAGQATLTIEPVKLGEGKLDAAAYPFAHLTGTGQFSFTKEQLTELRKYVLKGGTVVCDAAGGDSTFAESAQAQLTQIIGGSKLEPIAPEDPILALVPGTDLAAAQGPMVTAPPPLDPDAAAARREAAAGKPAKGLLPDDEDAASTRPDEPATRPAASQPASTQATTAPTTTTTTTTTTTPANETAKTFLPGSFAVEYRGFARQRLGASQALRLKGIKFRGKWAVIYSAEDLTVGMVGQPVDGIHGYTPTTSTEMMRRLVVNLTATPPTP